MANCNIKELPGRNQIQIHKHWTPGQETNFYHANYLHDHLQYKALQHAKHYKCQHSCEETNKTLLSFCCKHSQEYSNNTYETYAIITPKNIAVHLRQTSHQMNSMQQNYNAEDQNATYELNRNMLHLHDTTYSIFLIYKIGSGLIATIIAKCSISICDWQPQNLSNTEDTILLPKCTFYTSRILFSIALMLPAASLFHIWNFICMTMW